MTRNIKCRIKLFADDTSLFTMVCDESLAAFDLKRDLAKVSLWAWQCKMKFNADKTEVLFSCNREKPIHL